MEKCQFSKTLYREVSIFKEEYNNNRRNMSYNFLGFIKVEMAEPNTSTPTSGALPPLASSGAPPNIQKLVATKRLQQAQAQVR